VITVNRKKRGAQGQPKGGELNPLMDLATSNSSNSKHPDAKGNQGRENTNAASKNQGLN